MNEEAYPEAAAILRDAGWKPHDTWGVYTRGTLVMGFSPDGQNFDVKNWGLDVHGPDTPDDPIEAAQWLVRLRAVVLETPATLDPITLAQEPEQVETPQHESDGETGEAFEGIEAPTVAASEDGDAGETPSAFDDSEGYIVSDNEAEGYRDAGFSEQAELRQDLTDAEGLTHESNGETASLEGADVAMGGDDRPDDRDDGRSSLPGLHGPLVGGREEAAEGSGGASDDLLEPEASGDVGADPIDADFTIEDLGSEDLLTDDDFELPALEGADLPEEPPPEHPSGAFIFGDNLAHDRIVRIGQLAEIANALIDAAKAGYNESEHNAVRSHVVMNMNESGAYIGGDQALFDRFLELDAITSHVRRIEAYRDQRQDYIRAADRDSVANFDPAEGWP